MRSVLGEVEVEVDWAEIAVGEARVQLELGMAVAVEWDWVDASLSRREKQAGVEAAKLELSRERLLPAGTDSPLQSRSTQRTCAGAASKCSRSFSRGGRLAFLQEEKDLLGRLGIGMGPAARSQEETHGGWQGLLRYSRARPEMVSLGARGLVPVRQSC
jgi:hypothetical protein